MRTTRTISGDTWDTIALREYGNVLRAQELMEARENVRLLDLQVFPTGTVVGGPARTKKAGTPQQPGWRR